MKRRATITLKDGGEADINGLFRLTVRLPKGRGRKVEIEIEPIEDGLHLRRQPAAESNDRRTHSESGTPALSAASCQAAR